MNSIPKNLKLLRESRGYTQQQLGNYLNIERQSYGNYEKGCRTPDLHTIHRLADFYHIPLTTLIHENHLDDRLASIISSYLSASPELQKEIADYVACKTADH